MSLCKAYKSKTELIQCPNKIKIGQFCGKHKNISIPLFDENGYLLANNDLVNEGINTESLAIYHWINHGKKEKRKMC